jgi:hypothetical protein
MECLSCEEEMEKKSGDISMAGGRIVVRDLPFYSCPKCEKSVFEGGTIKMAEDIIKRYIERREDSVQFSRTVSFDGKNLLIRLPKALQEALKIERGDHVNMWAIDKTRIILALE